MGTLKRKTDERKNTWLAWKKEWTREWTLATARDERGQRLIIKSGRTSQSERPCSSPPHPLHASLLEFPLICLSSPFSSPPSGFPLSSPSSLPAVLCGLWRDGMACFHVRKGNMAADCGCWKGEVGPCMGPDSRLLRRGFALSGQGGRSGQECRRSTQGPGCGWQSWLNP